MSDNSRSFIAASEEEKNFLKQYNMDDYGRPSVTTDIVVLSISEKDCDCHRKDANCVLEILLVRRGEHPYKNRWALPGGFLKMDETIEECALRELREETNLTPVRLMPVGVFSNPGRDPRGRVISNAFASVIGEKEDGITGGGDASEARWFTIEFDLDDEGNAEIVLVSDSEEIKVRLREKVSAFRHRSFEEVSDSGLAFDHGEIIATALAELRKQSADMNTAFDFLPDKFTLSALQKVQEILEGKSFLTANFRRKTAGLVEETDEFTEGAGHRPARLFKRKG